MDSQEFYELAKELWGIHWATILANKFDVRVKSVKRWASGKNEIPVAAVEFLLFQKEKRRDQQ